MTDWPALVRDHGPRLLATAHRLVSNEADAADCVQRAFLDALRLAGVRDWPAALTRLVTARSLDCLRRRYRRAGRAAPLHFDPPGGADPLARAAEGELADALRRALAAVDPRSAELFCLVALDGWAVAAAAAHLGLTAGHAGVLLQRARADLRGRLRAFDPNPGVTRD